MRTLLIGTLAATLVGCSRPLPPQISREACTFEHPFACFNTTAASQPIEPNPKSSKTSSARTKVGSTIAANTEKPPSAHVRYRVNRAAKTAKSTTIGAKVEATASEQPVETSDPVIIRAMTTIAAKLEEPASAEFGEMKRAIRKNTFGQPIDTICGSVKGKSASGEDTGERPFLYLVKDDDAYVADGPAGSSAAAIAYRNICK
jgi:hypothetical protein